jgi:uncharacterized protein with FMN-binding domain
MSRRTPSLARRIFPALALSTVGVGMVHALDRPNPVGALGQLVPSTDPNAVTTIAPIETTTTVAPVVTNQPSTSTPVTAAPAPITNPPTTAAATGNDCGAVNGTGASTTIAWRRDYGVIQVTAKFTSAGVLCKASANYQTYDGRSQRYEDWAVPVLNQQAKSAGSANIQGVSGATAVSQAYQKSLQSAIDNRK